jgi:hypothetical protein
VVKVSANKEQAEALGSIVDEYYDGIIGSYKSHVARDVYNILSKVCWADEPW